MKSTNCTRKLDDYNSNGAVPLHISLKNNFEWMAFSRLNCFCYYFISPLKAKESKLETQKTFVAEFAEAELERKSMANANLLSICRDVFSSFFTKQIPNFLFRTVTDTFSICMLC